MRKSTSIPPIPALPLYYGILIAVLFVMFGCALAPILPGQDAITVNAERSTSIALDAVDGFLNFDNDNRALLQSKAPAVHVTAERLRADAPKAFSDARTYTALYDASKSVADGNALNDKLTVVSDMARDARLGLIAAQAAKGK